MADMAETLLAARGVTKRFGAVTACEGIDLSLAPGEIHALLGENGAGKSTLVKILFGVITPDEGSLSWEGEPLMLSGPADARQRGIAMVFQHFAVFDALSVAENIALALPGIGRRALRERLAALSAEYGLAIEPDRAMHSLSVGEKQRVEVLRCLMQEPKLLILDEPTSVLTPQEAEALFVVLERLRDRGCAILYISHKLDEVRAIATRATVLRRGRVVAEVDPRAESAARLAALMVGADVRPPEKPPHQAEGPVRLALRNLALPAADDFATPLSGISLALRGGEILGIAGIAGSGQSELMAALIGERRVAAGMVEIDGTPAGRLGPRARRRLGAAFVPEERNGHGAIGTMALSENLALSRLDEIARGGLLSRGRARSILGGLRERFDIRGPEGDPAAASLSGGNLQKFVIGREIDRRPGVLVVNQPSWGVDPGAAAAIRQALLALAAEGSAVLMISQDLDEILALSDRVAVLHAGRLSAPRPVAEMTAERIGLLMGGAHPEAAPQDGGVPCA